MGYTAASRILQWRPFACFIQIELLIQQFMLTATMAIYKNLYELMGKVATS